MRNHEEQERNAETEAFLVEHCSDDDSDNGSEDGKNKGQEMRVGVLEANGNSVMGNLNARISRVEIGGSDDADWDDFDGVIDGDGGDGSKAGGLSAKAGVILVCTDCFPSWMKVVLNLLVGHP
jgi:hypothetical protein